VIAQLAHEQRSDSKITAFSPAELLTHTRSRFSCTVAHYGIGRDTFATTTYTYPSALLPVLLYTLKFVLVTTMFSKSIQSSFALCAAAAGALAATMMQTTIAFAPRNIAHRSVTRSSSGQNTGSALSMSSKDSSLQVKVCFITAVSLCWVLAI
jgi:hypothetical protein